MILQDLNKIIQRNLLTSRLIKNNLLDNLIIIENNHSDPTGKLQSVKLENVPTNNCWIFQHENPEDEFKVSGKKVEKTILLLSDDKKELIVILIEMKSGFKIKELFDCRKKVNFSLTHLSIFLAINNHAISKYNDYKIKFKLVIYCNNENIDTSNILINEDLCKNFLEYRNGNSKNFKIQINSPSIGFNLIPAICIHEKDKEHIIMDFKDLLSKLS